MSKNTITTKLPTALAPFTGVDNATARLLKAISAIEFGMLQDGDLVYVQSVRDYWKWVPTSTATDDCTGAAAKLGYCNPTVNGANPGRFERLFICSPDWLLQNFFIDNGAAGHNENSGATALLPLNNDIELYQRWSQGKRARIATAITVTYAQTPITQTNYFYELIAGGSLLIVGTPTISKAGTVLTAVQTQVRTAGAELGWAITAVGLAVADLSKLAVITASGTPANVGAYTHLLKDEGGGKLRVSPFGTYNATTGAFTQVTPLVGDTIEIRDVFATTLSIGKFEECTQLNDPILATLSRTTFDSIGLNSNVALSNAQGGIVGWGGPIYYVRTLFKQMTFAGQLQNVSALHLLRGGGIAGGFTVNVRTNVNCTLIGVGASAFLQSRPGGHLSLLVDCYFQNARCLTDGGSINSNGCAFFDTAASGAITLSMFSMSIWVQAGGVPDWGTANTGFAIHVGSECCYSYVVKPTVNSGLGVGRESRIGGTDKLYTSVPYIEGANNAAMVLTA